MNHDWSTTIFFTALVILGVLTAASLVRAPRPTISALVGCVIYVPSCLGLFICIAFDKPRKALPKYLGKARRSVGALLNECWQTATWLWKLAWRPMAARARGSRKATSSELSRETPGGRL